MLLLRRSLLAALLVVPAAALAVLAFESGGYYPGATAVATLVALGGLAAWALLAPGALAGLGPQAAILTGALAALAGWTLLSGSWSHAPGRALIEFDRVLLYIAIFALFALAGRTGERARALVAILAVAALVVAVGALGAYLLPDLLPVPSVFQRRRMSYPTGYWNATGMLAGLGVIWSLHLASASREHLGLRVAGAAAIAPLVAVLAYTASRGAVAATIVGVAVYVLATRSRAVAIGLLACVPAALASLAVVSQTPALSGFAPLPPAAIAQGERGAWALLACAGCAVVLRAWLTALERRLARVELPALSHRVRARATIGALVVVLAVGVAAGAPGLVSHLSGRFAGAPVDAKNGQSHLTSFSSDRRTQLWHIALKYGFAPDPLRGNGAGTFAVLWERNRQVSADELVAPSLYIGTLAEVGLVGAVPLFAVLLALVIALARRSRAGGADAGAWAGLLGGAAAWLVFAAVDWSWQIPACTTWLFAAGGLAASRAVDGRATPPRQARLRVGLTWTVRLAIAAGAVALAVVPLALARSERSLERAIVDLQHGDCAGAYSQASTSRAAVSQRAAPYMVLAYCAARERRYEAALRYAAAAVERDRFSWEVHYAQGLVQAAAGRSPGAALRTALRLNPRGSYAIEASALLDRGSTGRRRRLAMRLPIPLAEDVCGGPTQARQVAACGDPKLPTLGAGPPVATTRP